MPAKNGIKIKKDILKINSNEMALIRQFYEKKMKIISDELKKLFELKYEQFQVIYILFSILKIIHKISVKYIYEHNINAINTCL